MFIKSNSILLLLGMTLLLACQKEDPVLPPAPTNPPPTGPHPYAHLEGEFNTERLVSGGYSDVGNTGSWKDTADAFLTCRIDGDSLNVMGFCFPLDSLTQTRFYYRDGVGSYGVTTVEVNFANNYDSIYITYQTPCSYYGNCSTISYKGKRGSNTHRPISALYSLWVEHKETATGIDTQYRKDIMVNYSRYQPSYQITPDRTPVSFNLDGEVYNFRGFESSFSGYKTIIYHTYDKTTQQVYWKNDSFYLKQQIRSHSIPQTAPADTTYWLYKGSRL